VIFGAVMFTDVVHLGMTVMARGDAVVCARGHDLFEFQPAVSSSGFGKTGLQKTAPAPAAVIVRSVGKHVDVIFFSDDGFDDKPQILRHRIAETFPDQLAGILNREFDFQVFVPLGVDLELSFPNPLGIQLNDALDFEIVGNVELFQSRPDCK